MSAITKYDEIIALRKCGDYKSAYEMATVHKSEEPDCLWVNNQIGWCLFEMLKANATIANSEEFLLRLQEVVDLNNERPLDGFIVNNLVWPIRTFVVNCCSTGNSMDDLLYRTFGLLQQIPFDPANGNYGILLGAFIKAKKWAGLKEFIEWWNLDNIKEKDCEPYITEDGKKVMSVAEQVYIAYSNILLDEISNNVADESQVAAFAQRLSEVAKRHPEFQYPSYFQAKLLLGIGHKEDAITALLPFVKKKPKDYWVWDLLGDAEADDNLRISCYSKALSCHGKEQYLRKLHLKLCDLLLKKEMYNEARAELVAAITISNNNGWVLPYKYQDYTTEAWYLNADKETDNREFYKKKSASAEQLTYADYPQLEFVVVRINKEKQVASFVTAGYNEGFFSCRSIKCKVGGTYRCRVENDVKNHYKVYTCEPINGVERGLVKEFSGTVSIKQNGFGFVGDVFVPASMLKGVEDGLTLSGKAIPSYDEKKDRWGWAALRLFDNKK